MLAAALGLALVAPAAHAMGLGPLQVKSGLNQPLVAEIPILSATSAELEALDVRLASPDAFARVGLERPLELTANLQFSVGTNAKGQPVIRVTTPGRFQEPFLSFLIEANWGKGTVTREYTALIDPPYIAPAVIRPLTTPSVAVEPPPVYVPPAPPVATPAPQPQPEPEQPLIASEPEPTPAPIPQTLPPEPAPRPVATTPPPRRLPPPGSTQSIPAQPQPQPQPEAPAPAPTPAPPPAAPVAQPGEYGPVSSGQTLWSIAESVRPDPSVTVNQVMLALQRANPDAFDKDNINRLKRGSVLRIPRQEEMASLSPAEAAVLVREQATSWRGTRAVPQPAESVAGPAPEAAPAPARAPATAAAKPARRPSQPRLEIVPPSGSSGARGAQSGAAAGAGGTELRAQLTQAKEDLAARTAEVAELKSRVADLERIDKNRQQLIDVQNSQLKQLQDRLKELEAQQAAAGAKPAVPTPDTAATPPVETPAPAATTPDATVAATPEPAPTPAAKPAKPAVTTPTPEPAKPAQPLWMNPFVLGGGALVLFGAVVMLLLRGRRKPEPLVIGGNEPKRISDDEALRASLARTKANTTPRAEVAAAAAVPAAAVVETDAELEAAQAAVRAKPNDLESHLSLLRLYHSRGNALEYETAAQAMRMRVGSPTDPRWREAVVMGASLMPGHPLFSQAGWNAPRFDEPAKDKDGIAAPASLKPKVVPYDESPATVKSSRIEPPPTVAVPVPKPAPVPVPEPEPELVAVDIDAEWDKAMNEARDTGGESLDFEHAGDDVHRNEAEVLAEDEASATRIELAKAYLDIGDLDGARSMLEEVFNDGGPAAKAEAERILKEIG